MVAVASGTWKVPVSQISASAPAKTVGDDSMVKIMSSVAFGQPAAPYTVIVNVTDPVMISFAPGVYVGLRRELSLKLPSPLLAQYKLS